MRKISFLALAILLCLAVSSSAVCPAPFERAKAMALAIPEDSQGRHLIHMVVNRNGIETTYIIGYIKWAGFIGIGKICGSTYAVYEYNEQSSSYTVWKDNRRHPIDPKTCIHQAFEIFREMVAESLL